MAVAIKDEEVSAEVAQFIAKVWSIVNSSDTNHLVKWTEVMVCNGRGSDCVLFHNRMGKLLLLLTRLPFPKKYYLITSSTTILRALYVNSTSVSDHFDSL